MKVNKKLGMILLSVWLILTGLFSLLNLSFTGSGVLLAILAIAAGVVILLRVGSWSAKLGMILLAIWLIATGLVSLLDLSFTGIGVILAILAVAAGILILLKR